MATGPGSGSWTRRFSSTSRPGLAMMMGPEGHRQGLGAVKQESRVGEAAGLLLASSSTDQRVPACTNRSRTPDLRHHSCPWGSVSNASPGHMTGLPNSAQGQPQALICSLLSNVKNCFPVRQSKGGSKYLKLSDSETHFSGRISHTRAIWEHNPGHS